MNAIELLPPHMRNLPDAAEFAELLAEECPAALHLFDGVGQYGWEAPIPPRSEWQRHAEEFAEHVNSYPDGDGR